MASTYELLTAFVQIAERGLDLTVRKIESLSAAVSRIGTASTQLDLGASFNTGGLESAVQGATEAIGELVRAIENLAETMQGLPTRTVVAGGALRLFAGTLSSIPLAFNAVVAAGTAFIAFMGTVASAVATAVVGFKAFQVALTGVKNLLEIGAGAVAAAAEYERLQIQLKALTGSAELAAVVLEKLFRFSDITPFTPDEAQRAGAALLRAFPVEELEDRLTTLGNIAAAFNLPLESLSEAFVKAASRGKVTLEVLELFQSKGVPVLEALSDALNVTRDDLLEMISRGELGFAALDKAIQSLGDNDTGRFAGALEDQSRTILGLWSTVRGRIESSVRVLGQFIVGVADLRGFLAELVDRVNLFADRIALLLDPAGVIGQAYVDAFRRIRDAIGPTTDVLARFERFLAIAVGAGAGLLQRLATIIEERLGPAIDEVFGTQGITDWAEVMEEARQAIVDVDGAIGKLKDSLATAIDQAIALGRSLTDELLNTIQSTFQGGAGSAFLNFVSELGSVIGETFRNALVNSVINVFQGVGDNARRLILETVAAFFELGPDDPITSAIAKGFREFATASEQESEKLAESMRLRVDAEARLSKAIGDVTNALRAGAGAAEEEAEAREAARVQVEAQQHARDLTQGAIDFFERLQKIPALFSGLVEKFKDSSLEQVEEFVKAQFRVAQPGTALLLDGLKAAISNLIGGVEFATQEAQRGQVLDLEAFTNQLLTASEREEERNILREQLAKQAEHLQVAIGANGLLETIANGIRGGGAALAGALGPGE